VKRGEDETTKEIAKLRNSLPPSKAEKGKTSARQNRENPASKGGEAAMGATRRKSGSRAIVTGGHVILVGRAETKDILEEIREGKGEGWEKENP